MKQSIDFQIVLYAPEFTVVVPKSLGCHRGY